MRIDRDSLLKIEAPTGTDTWTPISHKTVDEFVRYNLFNKGIVVVGASYAVSKDGADAVGSLKLCANFAGGMEEYHRQLVCWRNSIGKRASLAFTTGSEVLFCTNQMHLGSWLVTHKHTSKIRVKLAGMWETFSEHLYRDIQHIEDFYCALAEIALTEQRRNDALVRLCRRGALTWTQIPHVLNAMHDPDNDRVGKDTLLQLYNAYTYTLNGKDARYNAQRTPLATDVFKTIARECGTQYFPMNPVNSTAEAV